MLTLTSQIFQFLVFHWQSRSRTLVFFAWRLFIDHSLTSFGTRTLSTPTLFANSRHELLCPLQSRLSCPSCPLPCPAAHPQWAKLLTGWTGTTVGLATRLSQWARQLIPRRSLIIPSAFLGWWLKRLDASLCLLHWPSSFCFEVAGRGKAEFYLID